jgi:hypothetical protein
MSGDSTATGRSGCLKPGEIDPARQAQPCVEQVEPPVTIPEVGGGWSIFLPILLAIIVTMYFVRRK